MVAVDAEEVFLVGGDAFTGGVVVLATCAACFVVLAGLCYMVGVGDDFLAAVAPC